MKVKVNILLFFVIICLGACSSIKTVSQKSDTQLNAYTDGDISYKNQFRFKSMFFESQRLKALEEFEKAAALMEQCLSIDPFNADAHYEMALLYITNERTDDAVFHAEKSFELNPNNIWVIQLLSQLYQISGNNQGELNAYKNLVDKDPSNIEYQFLLATAYSKTGNYKKAIQVYNKIESQIGVNEDLSVMKEHLYITMGDVELAADEIIKLIAAFPNEMRFLGMLAELYQANDLTEKSIGIYNEVLSLEPKNPAANIALAEYYRVNNNHLKAFEYLSFCFDNDVFDLQMAFQILSSYFKMAIEDQKYLDPLLSLLNKALISHSEEASIFGLSGDIHFHLNNSKKAFEAYESSLNYGATEYLMWSRYLLLGLELLEYDRVYENGLKAIELYPFQPTLYLFTGFAASYNKEYEKSLSLFKKGVNYVVNNTPLKAEFYSYLGDAYHSVGDDNKSDECYEKSLDLIPDNIVVLNNYSYYLSLRGKDLEKAERMSKQCVELVPDQSTYEDTYGWVLYKQKRFNEAKEWLGKAINTGDNSPVILEHYGDVLYNLGEKKEALEYWKKAKGAGGNSELLNKKVREGVLHE
ncbi:MAG: hypothetical protein CND86_02965 [Bacteroidetes bacterium MED-G21]|nr:MAG: hypothetical protein CND86_02965 [Bacteroidetes bacterium MED-G21]